MAMELPLGASASVPWHRSLLVQNLRYGPVRICQCIARHVHCELRHSRATRRTCVKAQPRTRQRREAEELRMRLLPATIMIRTDSYLSNTDPRLAHDVHVATTHTR